MISAIIVVLIICALIAAIFGREAAQKVFGCIVTLVVIAVIALVVVYGATMHWMHNSSQ